jgi:hypothetical protein
LRETPKFTQNGIFGLKIYHLATLGKSVPKIGATSERFKKLPKVHNHPMGKNFPNLVTLLPHR